METLSCSINGRIHASHDPNLSGNGGWPIFPSATSRPVLAGITPLLCWRFAGRGRVSRIEEKNSDLFGGWSFQFSGQVCQPQSVARKQTPENKEPSDDIHKSTHHHRHSNHNSFSQLRISPNIMEQLLVKPIQFKFILEHRTQRDPHQLQSAAIKECFEISYSRRTHSNRFSRSYSTQRYFERI